MGQGQKDNLQGDVTNFSQHTQRLYVVSIAFEMYFSILGKEECIRFEKEKKEKQTI